MYFSTVFLKRGRGGRIMLVDFTLQSISRACLLLPTPSLAPDHNDLFLQEMNLGAVPFPENRAEVTMPAVALLQPSLLLPDCAGHGWPEAIAPAVNPATVVLPSHHLAHVLPWPCSAQGAQRGQQSLPWNPFPRTVLSMA